MDCDHYYTEVLVAKSACSTEQPTSMTLRARAKAHFDLRNPPELARLADRGLKGLGEEDIICRRRAPH